MTEQLLSDTELASRLRLAIARLSRQLRQQAGTGLSPSQQSLLATVEQHGPITLGDLAGVEQIAPPTVTKVVAKLEDDGLVERATDPTDRRVSRVSLTKAGAARLDESRNRRNAYLAEQLHLLEVDDVHRLLEAIDVLERLARPERDQQT